MLKAPEYVIPPRSRSLGYLAMWWIEQHLVVPQGDLAGEPFVPTIDHRVWLANWYAVKPTAALGDKAAAFRYRTGVWMAAQKVGKSPGIAAETCFEFVGPALFAGWAEDGEYYSCEDNGCPCEGVYMYEAGEPKGRHWSTPRIQLAAVVEDQVENTWGALIPMINNGPLANVITKTGEAFIRHPNGNRDSRVEIVTSSAKGRLGARITAAKCDETGLWTESNKMKEFINTLRRGVAGMGGRVSQTTNAYNPAEKSVAQDTHESKRPDVLKHYFPPPENLRFELKKDRLVIFRWNYQHSPWVDVRDIEAEAMGLFETDPAEAERFFGNRLVAGSGSWLKMDRWAARKASTPIIVKPRTRLVLGFDGSDNDDHTGIRAETLDGYQFTPRYGDQRARTHWEPADHGGRIPRAEVMSAFRELVTEFEVVRAYCDVQFWETEIDLLASEFGEKVFLKWHTERLLPMHAALERLRTDVYNTDSDFSHDGDEKTRDHLRHAIVRSRGMDALTKVRRYIIGKPAEHQKIDLAMSSVLAHEARMDAIAAGALETYDDEQVYF